MKAAALVAALALIAVRAAWRRLPLPPEGPMDLPAGDPVWPRFTGYVGCPGGSCVDPADCAASGDCLLDATDPLILRRAFCEGATDA